MKTKILSALVVSLLGSVALADSLNLTITIKAKDQFRMLDSRTAEGVQSRAESTISMRVTANGETFSESMGSNIQIDELKMNLFDIEKGSLRFVDDTQKMNTKTPAEIDRSILGKLKTIRVSADNIKGVFAENLRKAGKDFISQVEAASNEGQIKVATNFSDYVCQRDNDTLSCDLEMSIVIEGKDKN